MDEIRIDSSPRLLARLCGANYVVIIILGMFVELFVRGRIVVAGNAAATTTKLRAMETLWRVGIAAELVMVLCAVFSAMVIYVLLRPVSRDLALLATFFSLVAAAVEAAHSLKLLEALFPLGAAAYLDAFTPEQLEAMASLAMKSHASGYGMALLLFGPLFLVRGYLILKSFYLPRALGLLYQLSGVSYLALGFGLILAPRFASRNFMAITLPAFIGEASLALWLLVKGVDMEAWELWRARGSRSGETS